MSLFNPLANASVPTHRSSFDLSTKRLYTAKVGELLPIWWTIALPSDKFKLSVDSFTRTVPVNTAAYTRIKEYFDFFCVPLRYLNSNLNNALMQMTDFSTIASSNSANMQSYTKLPWTTTQALNDKLLSMHKADSGSVGGDYFNSAGLYKSTSAIKLLDLLGYQAIKTSDTITDKYSPEQEKMLKDYFGGFSDVQAPYTIFSPYGGSQSFAQNLLPLLAYQKIYYDFYSNSQWETHKAYSYNTDYWDASGSALPLTDAMLELHYANYPQDYIQGVLPNSQYGNTAVLPATNPQFSPNSIVAGDGKNVSQIYNPASGANVFVDPANDTGQIRYAELNTNLTALSIRATQLLQRWKEVVQFSGKDFKQQVKAQFGVTAPDYMGNHCRYIGGVDNVIAINEVVNTNLTDASHQANIAGKGSASQSGRTFDFESPAEHCVIMCIYHAVPLCDYDLNGIAPQLLDINISDLPQPAFDNLGLEPFKGATVSTDAISTVFRGYTVRYSSYKSDIDKVTTGFRGLGIYHSWAAPLDAQDMLAAVKTEGVQVSSPLAYNVFKVKPQQLNSIFVPQVDRVGGIDKDQLLINSYIKCYKVTNLSRSGIPW